MDFIYEYRIVIAGWIVTLAYLSYFSYRYFNDIEYELLERSGDGKERLFETLRIQPVYPRWLVSQFGYGTWFVAFLFYVLTLYFITQMVLDTFTRDEIDKIRDTSPWLATFPQLTAAFIVSGVVAGVPKLDILLTVARSVCHRSAAIPTRAKTIVDHIDNHRVELSAVQVGRAVSVSEGTAFEDDAKAPKGAPEYQWIMTCFYVDWLRRKKQIGTVYASVMATHAVGFDALERQFERTRENLRDMAADTSRRFTRQQTRDEIKLLHDRAIQTFVCIVLSSESSYADARDKLTDEGLISTFLKDYQPALFGAIVGVMISFVAFFTIGFVAHGLLEMAQQTCDGVVASTDASFALGTALGGTIMLTLPALSIFMLKAALAGPWPLRFPGGQRKNFIYLGCLLFGIAQGALWLFVLGYYNIVNFEKACDPNWYVPRLPWSILTGIVCALTAWSVDRIPVVKGGLVMGARALVSGVLVGALFFVVALLIQIIREDLSFAELTAAGAMKLVGGQIATVPAIGVVLAIYISIIADCSSAFRNKESEQQMYIASLLLSTLEHKVNNPRDVDEHLRLEAGDFDSPHCYTSLQGKRILTGDGAIAPELLEKIRAHTWRAWGENPDAEVEADRSPAAPMAAQPA